MSNIYNISSSCCFVETLAQKLLNEYADTKLDLAKTLILLPNRRACRSLAEAFVRLQGMKPTLLPQMRAIGDVDEDEILFNNALNNDSLLSIPPAISSLERTLLLTRLIISRHKEFGLENVSLAQACSLAQELGSLFDNVAMRNLDWNNLQNIVPENYAAHWQETLKFLSIISHYWPDILAERGMIDTVNRRESLMQKQCRLWQATSPQQRIIIAGTTGVSPAMKEFVRTILLLPYGEVYLYGLDKILDEDSWNCIDECHPQYELKQLLEYLQISRESIPDLITPRNFAREQLISEIMRPAVCSDKWLDLSSHLNIEGLDGLHLIETTNTREEALSIALIMRKTLETPTQTVALVTPDRNLARRVCGELSRWNIIVDDSAGIPLNQTPWGIFIRLIAATALNSRSKEQFLALLKTNLLTCSQSVTTIRHLAEQIDKNLWRLKINDESAQNFLDQILNALTPLNDLFNQDTVSFYDILCQHIALAEKLSSTNDSTSDMTLWKNDDGQAGASFISELLDKSEILGDISPDDYPDILEKLMSGVMVRNTTKTHPRIKILGPLEARLNHYDIIIIGGCNEGTWPQTPSVDPWMSRPMKHDFGLSQPEQQIGVTALDFANLLGAQTIYLTRSQMNDGAQTVKSRWWMRLTTILQALHFDHTQIYDKYFSELSKKIDCPTKTSSFHPNPPAPCPPLNLRPKRLSASAIERLMRDPYSVFAKYILNLEPLDELDAIADQSDFGNLVHKVLEDFANTYPQEFPQNAREILLKLGKQAFSAANFSADKMAFWQPKFQQIVEWIITQESSYRQQISHIYSEIWGNLFLEDPEFGRFEIYAKADRVDRTTDGKYNIIDYKTGRARSAKEIRTGYAPQLPIEALIAKNGGFTNLPPAEINRLMYWKLNDKVIDINSEIDQILASTKQHIIDIIKYFSQPRSVYLSRPNPKHVPEYSDYEHLARVKEWSVQDDGDAID